MDDRLNENQERDQEYNDSNFSDEVIQQLRESGLEEAEAPSVERDPWSPKEINLRRSAWIVRGLIVFLVMIFLGEVYLLSAIQPEEPQVIARFEGGPGMEIMPAPVVQAPFPPPPVAGAPEGPVDNEDVVNYPPPPTPTPPPLPPELNEVEIPPPDA